jgi:hypothetical protein
MPAPAEPPPEPPAPPATAPEDDLLSGSEEELPVEPPAPLTPEEEKAAVASSTALRAALPPPASTWTWQRDLVFDGFRLGTVTIEAEPATLADKPVWYVLERTVRQAGEGRVVTESSCFLSPDLSLIRGETVLRAPAGTETFHFGRREGRMEVTAEASGEEETVDADVPLDATIGLFPVIRLLEAAFAKGATAPLPLRLAVFDPRQAFGDGTGKPVPPGRADVVLTQAPGREGPKADVQPVRVAARTASGRASTFVLRARDRTVAAVRGTFPHWDVVSAGPAAKRPDWFDRVGETPQSAYQALCSFGRGYHMMKRDLLDMAFYWPTMREHEIAAGNYGADVTLQKVKEDFITEFLAQSKNRTAADCDDLLTQILVTSEITKHADGRVSIAALPVYGGHTFHCAEMDGRWWIMKVD